MKKLMLTVATAALGIGMALPGIAQTTDADCRQMFDTADANKDGSLGAGESDKFIQLMSTKPKDAAMVTMEEFMAECRKDAFKSVQEAALTPAPESTTEAKSSSDTATEQTTTTAEEPATSTTTTTVTTTTETEPADQSAASTATTTEPSTTEQTATAEQPATTTTTEQTATAEQPATTTTTEQTATAEQPATATTTEQTATAEQPATTTTTEQTATAEQPAATGEATVAGAPGDMLASKLIGTTVMSNDNQNIGEINDIVIDVENEKAAQAIIGVGGFLGIGEKNVAVELNRLNVRTDGTTGSWTVVLDTTEDELKQMPEYQAAAN